MVIRRVSPLSCARILGVMYALLGLVVGVIFAGVGGLIGSLGAGEHDALPPMLGWTLGAAGVIVMPILYGLMGAIGGAISAVLYNLIAGWMGGIEIDVDGPAARPATPSV